MSGEQLFTITIDIRKSGVSIDTNRPDTDNVADDVEGLHKKFDDGLNGAIQAVEAIFKDYKFGKFDRVEFHTERKNTRQTWWIK